MWGVCGWRVAAGLRAAGCGVRGPSGEQALAGSGAMAEVFVMKGT